MNIFLLNLNRPTPPIDHGLPVNLHMNGGHMVFVCCVQHPLNISLCL